MEEKLKPCSDSKKLRPCSDSKKLRSFSDSKKLRSFSDSKEQKQQLILAHIVVRGRKSEFYVLDLENDRITKNPVAVLLNQGAAGAHTVYLGSMIYVIGGRYLEHDIMPEFIVGDHHIHLAASCAELNLPRDGILPTTEADIDSSTDANTVAHKGGLVLEPTRFQAAPELPYYRCFPCCAVLDGKIYSFGDSDLGLLVQVFEPEVGEWKETFPPLPSSTIQPVDNYLGVFDPVIPDHKNHRLIMHFNSISALFAYYPATATLECLAKEFRLWYEATTLLDDVLYRYTGNKPECISAYDLSTKAWLKVTYSEKFPAKFYRAEFTNMLPLGNNVLCLANSCTYEKKKEDNSIKSNLQLFKIKVHRTSSEEVLVTLLGANCFTFNGHKIAKHCILL